MKKKLNYTTEQMTEILNEIRQKRDAFCIAHCLTENDVWLLIDTWTHEALLKYPYRVSEGPDRITRQCVLGMHVVHDNMKQVWIIPKKKLPKEEL